MRCDVVTGVCPGPCAPGWSDASCATFLTSAGKMLNQLTHKKY